MITRVRVSNFFGVRRGTVEGLAALTVLVGRNGSGKTTLLDAIDVGGSDAPARALADALRRRGGWQPERYVIGRDGTAASLDVEWESSERRSTTITASSESIRPERFPAGVGPHEPLQVLALAGEDGLAGAEAATFEGLLVGAGGGRYAPWDRSPPAGTTAHLGRLVGAAAGAVVRDLNAAVEAGADTSAFDLLRPLIGPGFRDLYPLAAREGRPDSLGVHVRFTDGRPSLPLELMGDGVQVATRLALAIAAQPPSRTLLVEEPELHLHPGGLAAVARVLWAAVERGAQLACSTHSIELVDQLVAVALEGSVLGALDRLAVIRLALQDGALRAHVVPGAEVHELRDAFGEDLR